MQGCNKKKEVIDLWLGLLTKELKIAFQGQSTDDLKKLRINRPESSFYVLLLDKKKVFSEKEICGVRNEYPRIRIFYAAIDSG